VLDLVSLAADRHPLGRRRKGRRDEGGAQQHGLSPAAGSPRLLRVRRSGWRLARLQASSLEKVPPRAFGPGWVTVQSHAPVHPNHLRASELSPPHQPSCCIAAGDIPVNTFIVPSTTSCSWYADSKFAAQRPPTQPATGAGTPISTNAPVANCWKTALSVPSGLRIRAYKGPGAGGPPGSLYGVPLRQPQAPSS
jgi:hypothetical protein